MALSAPVVMGPPGSVRPAGRRVRRRIIEGALGRSESHVLLPLLLVACSALMLLSADRYVFLGSSLLGAAVAVFIVVGLLFDRIQVRVSWLLACGLLLGYGLGSFNTAARLANDGVILGDYFGRTQGELSVALAFVYLVAAVLLFGGHLMENPIATTLESYGLSATDSLMVYAGCALVAAAFATGGLGYMGVQSSLEHRVSVLGAMAGVVSPALPGFTMAVQAKCRPRVRTSLWLCIAVEVVALVPQGRRITICGVLVLIFVYLRVNRASRLFSVANLTVISLSLVFLYGGNVVFYAMRHSVNESGDKSANLLDTTRNAYSFLTERRDGQFDEQVSENSRDRTFILTYFSDLLAANWSHEPLYGRDVLYCLQSVIPSGLFADKTWVLDIGMEETLANPQFGLFPQDEANSILTTGISDFGVWGVFLYPVVLVGIMAFLLKSVGQRCPGPLHFIAVLLLINLMVQSEVPGTAYVAFCRDLPLVLLMLWPVYALPYLATRPRRVDVGSARADQGLFN